MRKISQEEKDKYWKLYMEHGISSADIAKRFQRSHFVVVKHLGDRKKAEGITKLPDTRMCLGEHLRGKFNGLEPKSRYQKKLANR